MTRHDRKKTPILVRFYRATFLLLHLFAGVFEVSVLFPLYGQSLRNRAVGRWSARLLAIVNVKTNMQGKPPASGSRPRVLVANHVSWLDIQLIHCVWQVRFIAKSEVRRWPLIGWLSANAGTLFIERSRQRHAAHINQSTHAALRMGHAIGVFPEGSTNDGRELTHFHGSLLQPAVDECAMVFPVALRYLDEAGNINVNASYVGETSLMESMKMILAERMIRADIVFLPGIDATGKTRRELAALTQAAIATELNVPVLGRKPGKSADLPGAPR